MRLVKRFVTIVRCSKLNIFSITAEPSECFTIMNNISVRFHVFSYMNGSGMLPSSTEPNSKPVVTIGCPSGYSIFLYPLVSPFDLICSYLAYRSSTHFRFASVTTGRISCCSLIKTDISHGTFVKSFSNDLTLH